MLSYKPPGVEVVAPNTFVVKGGVLIGSITNLDCGSDEILVGRKEFE
jgi:hypothetical protein